MPYTTYVHAEEQAADGFTATAACATFPRGKPSGDTFTLPKGAGDQWLIGGGVTSDTKPQAGMIVPTYRNGGTPIYFPGSIHLAAYWARFMRAAPIKMVEGDVLTGYLSNTNVNEGSILAYDIASGNAPKPATMQNLAALRAKYMEVQQAHIQVTSAAAVTYNSGGVSLDAAVTAAGDDIYDWLDTLGTYEIYAISAGGIPGATFGGILNISQLGGTWAGEVPGLPAGALSAVDFHGDNFSLAPEPIPFAGNSLPVVGMTATSAGAQCVILHIGRTK
jgi:hypothetical protein